MDWLLNLRTNINSRSLMENLCFTALSINSIFTGSSMLQIRPLVLRPVTGDVATSSSSESKKDAEVI